MNHEPFDTLAAGYALGALDGQDLVDFETHLAGGCRQCEATLREGHEAMATLARDLPPVAPPPAVKAVLLRRVSADERARRIGTGRRRAWMGWGAGLAAAAAVAAIVSGTYVAGRYAARIAALTREAEAIRQRLGREEGVVRELAAQSRALETVLDDPTARVIGLRGQGSMPRAVGRLLWSEGSGGYLVASRLDPVPEGRAYELWAIHGGTPRAAGVFRPDVEGRAVHRVAATGGPVDVFAITIEPASGVPAPTGPIVLASR